MTTARTTPDSKPDNKTDSRPDSKRKALGKGLESLLPSRPQLKQVAAAAEESGGRPLEIELDRIERNPFQTRTAFDEGKLGELAQSIAATGVVQPIVVKPLGEGRFQLITGERRLLASKKAGKTTIPALLREASDEQAMEMTVVENLQREDLNPMEQARAYQRLSAEFRMTQEQMAQRTGKERASVANFLRLLRLPDAVQDHVEAGRLSFGHARALLGLQSEAQMLTAAEKIINLALSVRQTETYVQGIIHPREKTDAQDKLKAREQATDPNVQEAALRLQRSLGLKVRIDDKKGRGKVVIEYSSLEDFDALMAALGGPQ